MTFDELPLFVAVWKVYMQTDQRGSDEWTGRKSRAMYKAVLQQIVDDDSFTEGGIPWGIDRVIDVWLQIRKGGEKIKTLCETAESYGLECWYRYRVSTPCSGDVDLDRLRPGSRGGVYCLSNCVIACSFHNRSRGDKPIEDFIVQNCT